jgi:hypothetical protein
LGLGISQGTPATLAASAFDPFVKEEGTGALMVLSMKPSSQR